MTRSSLAERIRDDAARLQAALNLESSTARIEVQSLLQQVLQVNRAYLLTYPEQQLDAAQQARYATLLQRRLSGEPLAYIFGEREFFGLSFKVTPATLIPRADTELLVELALERIPMPCIAEPNEVGRATPQYSELQHNQRASFSVLDLGTGSGAIALSIAHSCPHVDVLGVDASADALAVAGENTQRLQLSNVRLVQSDWFSVLQGERFNLIVSNPPYINADDAHLTQGDLRFEPRRALASGVDGLDDIRRILLQARQHLKEGGWFLFEHGYDQAERVQLLLAAAGYTQTFSACDLAGIARVTGGVA